MTRGGVDFGSVPLDLSFSKNCGGVQQRRQANPVRLPETLRVSDRKSHAWLSQPASKFSPIVGSDLTAQWQRRERMPGSRGVQHDRSLVKIFGNVGPECRLASTAAARRERGLRIQNRSAGRASMTPAIDEAFPGYDRLLPTHASSTCHAAQSRRAVATFRIATARRQFLESMRRIDSSPSSGQNTAAPFFSSNAAADVSPRLAEVCPDQIHVADHGAVQSGDQFRCVEPLARFLIRRCPGETKIATAQQPMVLSF